MDADLRARAEARLTEAAAALGLIDPRPAYRERLRWLREVNSEGFQRAIEHYESRVLPALAGEDPVAAWLDYGRFLAGITGTGELTLVDATGRATRYAPPPRAGMLVLFVPSAAGEAVLTAAEPVQPSPAQRATLDLLVERRLSL